MEIRTVAVIGGGLMGRQIALNTAIYPYEVYLTDANPEVLKKVAEWEEEYFIDLVVAGFYQDTSYAYEDGYGYIFVASDSSCIVQFYYYSEADVFCIYIYA